MKFYRACITKHFAFEVNHITTDELSHSKASKFHAKVGEAVDKANDYLRYQLMAIEHEFKEELEKVGK